MVQDHISKDRETIPKEVRESQAVFSMTAKALTNILGVGRLQKKGTYERCFDNVGSKAEDVPTVKFLPKVHKDVEPDGHPKSQPVCAAATVLSSRAGDAIADFLEPLVELEIPSMEDKSIEQVLAQLQEVEELIQMLGHTDTAMGSLDVQALYHQPEAGEGCRGSGEVHPQVKHRGGPL